MACNKMRTLFGEIFEASVCDSTEGWHLDAVGEVEKNVRWCKDESFGVRLSYDSDLS